jgi:PAS domain S-box-containing protein
MSQTGVSPNFSEYRTVGEAAEYLGVSPATLRNWDRNGKLKPRRHPQNGYRIYLHEDLEGVLRSANLSHEPDAAFAPSVDWSDMAETEHFVQFYESDDFLAESVSGFVGAALSAGQSGLVIATPEHRHAIQRRLATSGVDLSEAIESGRSVVLDAAETLSKFMFNGSPDPRRFHETVGGLIEQVARRSQRLHAFGEMVALLWADGNRDAAVRLEQLWNDLRQTHRFALFCAYPLVGFAGEGDTLPFDGICQCHSRVIPAESYAGITNRHERLLAISSLQQKAQSLEAEIAHRQEVEKALSKREAELADFFENATEGLHKSGPDGSILWANRADYALLGYTAEEYIGRAAADFHADAHVMAEIQERTQHGETLENVPARLRCKNGAIKHVLVNANAHFEGGKFLYSRCSTRDVTRQWEAEQALRDADRRKDEFLATLAHELRNPLAPIRNGLELLKLAGPADALGTETLEIIGRQVDQMTRLVDDLLDVSRITRDKIELRKERVELAAIVKNAVETSRPLIHEAGHTLVVSLPETPILLDADPTRIAQVFANLLNNSAKYTDRGGRIEIEAKTTGREAVVTVRDNGIGISCEALAFVFDMFRQVDRARNRAQGGLGIGLTLVRRLVELHGGTINAQSEGPGKGSELVVRLPLAEKASSEAKRRRAANRAVLSKQRILVVDDNRDAVDTLSTLLRIKSNEVRIARDGVEAVEIAAEFQPDIILMDVGMPRLNGFDATRQIRKMPWAKEVFIVALSGWGQTSDVKQSVEAGCSAHLVKPADFAALEQLLANRKPSRRGGAAP